MLPEAKSPTTNVRFDGLYQKHKHCEQCLEKNAELDINYRLQCRECGFRWYPEKSHFIGAKRLEEMINEIAAIIIQASYPEVTSDTLQQYIDRKLNYLRSVCFWFDDKTEAGKYVVRFNMFTRLIEQKNQLSHLSKKAIENV